MKNWSELSDSDLRSIRCTCDHCTRLRRAAGRQKIGREQTEIQGISGFLYQRGE